MNLAETIREMERDGRRFRRIEKNVAVFERGRGENKKIIRVLFDEKTQTPSTSWTSKIVTGSRIVHAISLLIHYIRDR